MKISAFRYLVVTAAAVCLSLPLAAQSSTAANRIVAPIDETNLVTLKGNVHPMVQARFDRGPAPLSTPTGRVMLVLQRSATQQQALTQYLADLQSSSSPNYHKWLTPAQYGAQFGISDSDLQTVQSWLQTHGFKIEKVPQGRNAILFSGNFEQLQTAFHTSIHSLFVNGENHFANMTDPQIPAALAPVVAGVGPLNDFHPKAQLKMGPQGHYDAATKRIVSDFTLSNGSTPLLFLDPADAATIYDTPNTSLNANYKSGTTYDGTGVNIGIGGTSDINLTDVANYRTGFLGETTPNVPTVIVDGNDPGLVSGWAVEGLLDVEVSGGLAPKAKVYFYTSADTDLSSGFVDAVFRAVDDNYISILSMSIGECEAGLGNSGNAQVLEGTEQAAAQGITVVVAASDNGSAGCDDFDTATAAQYGLQVNGFASTPYDIAVGGTDFDTLATAFSTYASGESTEGPPYWGTALKYIPENPWNDSTSANGLLANNIPARDSNGNTNIVAGSGGLSSCVSQTNAGDCEGGYAKPAFQTSLTPNDNVRDIPDVAFFAGNGDYDATWVLCSDPASDESTASYTECVNTNGEFSNSTYFDGVGGTSAAAPAFAGMLALVAQAHGSSSDNYRLGQADAILYQLAATPATYASVFHDIKVGNNSVVCGSGTPNCGTNGFLTGYNAGTGYDYASGLGSVDVKNLIADWTNVKLGATSTTLELNSSTAAYTGTHGANVTFKVGVNPTAATGVVAIVDNADETSGGTTAGVQNNGQLAIPLTSGAGTATYNGLPGGSYKVSARYGGDTSNASSTSSTISVDISAEPSTTTLEVNAYDPQSGNQLTPTGIPYGSEVFADAIITGTAEGANTQGTATGTVIFKNGTSTFGTANVSTNNLASYPPASNTGFVAFAPGSYNLSASYSGDASFAASSTSTGGAFTIAKASTTTAASASPTTVASGGSTTATATITSYYNDGNPPTGSVAFSLGGKTLATATSLSTSYAQSGNTVYVITTASASIAASQLAAGSNSILATYSGDTNYTTSSANFIVTGPAAGSITLTNSGNISVVAGATTGNTSTITVTPGGGFTGIVNLTCAVTTGLTSPTSPATCSLPASVTIAGTTASTAALTVSTTSTTTAGTYSVAVTGKDASTGKVTGTTTVSVTVTAAGTPTISLGSSGNISVVAGATTGNTSTITVTPGGGFTGIVNLTCAVTTGLTSPTSPATCSLPASVTIAGTTASTAALTVSTTSTTTAGTYSVAVTGKDASTGKVTGATTVTVTVTSGITQTPTIALTNSGNISVPQGSTSNNTSTITVTPGGGFTGSVNLTCAVTTSITNPNDPPTCSVASPVTISGTTPATATLTVATTAPTTSALQSPLDKFFLGGGTALALVFFFGVPGRRRAWRTVLSVTALGVVALIAIAGTTGCGGSSGTKTTTIPGTTTGTYTVTVTGADAATGKVTSTTAVTVTVTAQLEP